LEFEVRDLGVQHRGVVVGIDFAQVSHALDAGREEARIAQLGEHRRARRLEVDVAGVLHGRASGAARAPGFKSGEGYGTRTTSGGGAAQRDGRTSAGGGRGGNSRASTVRGQKWGPPRELSGDVGGWDQRNEAVRRFGRCFFGKVVLFYLN